MRNEKTTSSSSESTRKIQPAFDYNHAYRLGKIPGKRPIKVELMRFRDKLEIVSKASALKATNISIKDDLLPEERKTRAVLLSKRKELKASFPSATFTVRNDFLLVKNGSINRKFIVDKDMKVAEVSFPSILDVNLTTMFKTTHSNSQSHSSILEH
jgi:hypothetical protein